MEILETKERKMNKIKREEREDLHTFSDTTHSLQISITFVLDISNVCLRYL